MSINEIQDQLIDETQDLTDWMDRYAYIIELGESLDSLPESDKTPDNLIEGCQSRVWIAASLDADGNVQFRTDSDALIVKGIVAMLLRVLNGHKPKEILDSDLYFIERMGLKDHLSPTRSNGLVAMVKQMRMYALAFSVTAEKD